MVDAEAARVAEVAAEIAAGGHRGEAGDAQRGAAAAARRRRSDAA